MPGKPVNHSTTTAVGHDLAARLPGRGGAGHSGNARSGRRTWFDTLTARAPGRRIVAVSLAALLMTAACSGDDSGDDDEVEDEAAGDSEAAEESVTTTEADATTTTTEAEEPEDPAEAAEAAYVASVEAEATALNPPDAEHPDLLATETGNALEAMEGVIGGLEAEGAALDMDVQEVVVLDVDVSSERYVSVYSCEIRVVQRLVDGEPEGEAQRYLNLTTGGMVPTDDGWMLASFSQDTSTNTSETCPDPDAEAGDVEDGTDRYDN